MQESELKISIYRLDRHAEKPVLRTQPLVKLYVVGLPGLLQNGAEIQV